MNVLKEKIDLALKYVYNYYLNDDYMYRFFKGISFKDIQHYINTGFKRYISGDTNEAKRYFFKVGDTFYKENVPFSFFYDSINKLRYYLSKDETLNCAEYVDKLEDMTYFAENTFSYGYLVNLMKNDKDWIREELRIFKGKGNVSILSGYVKDHFIWLNKLLEDIKKLRSKPSIELNPNICEFGKKINNGDLDSILTLKYKDIVKRIHDSIHQSANEIYFFIEKRAFKNLLIEYINLFKNTSRLVSTIALVHSVSSEAEANIDPLTHLFNRRAMEIILTNQYTLSKITGNDFVIGLADMDDFKKINDTYGHLVGDCVLKEVAVRIKSVLRKSDFVFRYGGEEFLILLPYTTKREALKVLEKVRQSIIAEPIKCKNNMIDITISIGAASLTENPEYLEKLIELADKRLYKAKRTGKNKVVV
ncbi:sensor domain-containing diguanylate cyclase [Hydrogenivirga sp. 128-5-R1-1]|uniref:sensor domain-containing diguanylate cyclase n=1 Tax=Hydrogenivirga sp. 128-5-R1-1 TaxID=392423 RepID=UPI00015F0021|nr:sensor domain-containing diguanylate cyclase [Hydrogenivirga sp. 128-5-R1-1]EDP74339.1 hypothetical protein HG1285_11617 [Hydrogenivirga sp. 128-5-R1-1]